MKKAQGDLGFFLVWLFYLDTRCGANTFPPTKTDRPMALAYIRSFLLCR